MFVLQNFALASLLLFSWGRYKKSFCKNKDKQRVLWYFWKWPISFSSFFMWFEFSIWVLNFACLNSAKIFIRGSLISRFIYNKKIKGIESNRKTRNERPAKLSAGNVNLKFLLMAFLFTANIVKLIFVLEFPCYSCSLCKLDSCYLHNK